MQNKIHIYILFIFGYILELDLIKFENLFLDTEFESLENISLLRDRRYKMIS
jgi:hypothetical protein